MNGREGRWEASVSERLEQRSQLEKQLAAWCYAHAPEIRASMIEWRRRHQGHEPNALMVPSQYTAVAWGARFFGLYLVTSIYNDDLPITMPTPLHIMVPETLRERAHDLSEN